MNSGDAFVLSTEAHFYIWYGKGCNAGERKYSTLLADLLKARRSFLSFPFLSSTSEPTAHAD